MDLSLALLGQLLFTALKKKVGHKHVLNHLKLEKIKMKNKKK